ncbi:MAG: alkaline phosphatase family protein [Butyrivibrio sp.]
MINGLVLHDYENCIANLPNSILKNYGVNPVGKTLLMADQYLKDDYKNVVILLLDGLGTCILEGNLKEEGFLRKHFVKSFNTVFPPTTVAATTSIMSGLQPIEHAWLGWDCYYPQVDKNVTVFLNTEQGTDKPVAAENVPWKYCGYESVVDKLVSAGKKAYNVTPFVQPYPDSFDSICNQILCLCAEKEKKYIYAYWNEPDSIMHKYGCYSHEVKTILSDLESGIEKICGQLKDTLLIVTADHGHVDGRNVSITEYPQIMECLIRLPSIEPRALNLFVKKDKRKQFEREFIKEFGKDFVLLTKEEVYKEKLFGTGKPHVNADAMIGDYLAVSMTNLTIFNTTEEAKAFKGVHAGYTHEEMTVPFIVFDSNK